METKNVIIDCDTGVDDALALLLALRSPALNVLGITCVNGNVSIDKVVRNTLVVVEHSSKRVPVFRGCYQPLLGGGGNAEHVHGTDGLGDVSFPEPAITEERQHAVDFIIACFMETSQPIDLVTLAPLTNVALALQKEPRLAGRINSAVMMAGGVEFGNRTPVAEFNVWGDPEAADLVFRSGIPRKTIVPLDPNRTGGGIFAEDAERLAASPSPWCQMASRLLGVELKRWETHVGKGYPATPPDLAAMGTVIDPSLGSIESLYVAVETGGVHTRGMTVVDHRAFRGKFWPVPDPTMDVVLTLDNPRYRKLVLDTWLA